MQLTDIVEEVLRLPAIQRFEVVDQILRSLDKPDPEIDRLWGEEALHRLHAHDAGRSQTFSMDEVLGRE